MKLTNRFFRNTRLEKHFPQTVGDQTIYLSTGNPETFFNQTALYKAGELGKKFTGSNGKRYQIVQVDASAAGNSVANGLLYWANRTAFTVTPRETDSLNVAGLNGVAGRSPGITSVGNYLAMQIGGPAVLVYGGTNTNGALTGLVIGKATTLSDADALTTVAATSKVVGYIITAGTTTNATIGCSLTLDDGEVI